MLKDYENRERYWQYVQAISDCFFTAAERAEMCRELINEPLFQEDPGFKPFLDQARAELRCLDLSKSLERQSNVRPSIRSIS